MKLLNTHHPDQRFGESWNIYAHTLEESDVNSQGHEAAMEMLNLLARLPEIESSDTWYGHTSHLTLCLNREPATEAPCLVWIWPTGGGDGFARMNRLTKEDTGTFIIGYRIPDWESPWPEAEVQMHAYSVTDCLAALKIAFARCRYVPSRLAFQCRTLPLANRPSFSAPATAEKIAELEVAVGTSLPQSIRKFFLQHDSVSAMGVWNGCSIGRIDIILRSLERSEFPRAVQSRPVLPIATDGSRNAFLASIDSDGPVWKWSHENGATVEVAESFDAFLDRLADDFYMFAIGKKDWEYLSG
jgi:hypothetical protein